MNNRCVMCQNRETQGDRCRCFTEIQSEQEELAQKYAGLWIMKKEAVKIAEVVKIMKEKGIDPNLVWTE